MYYRDIDSPGAGKVEEKAFSCGTSPYKVEGRVFSIGTDLLVIIYGGDRPHIGSIAVALPRPSLTNRMRRSSTSSVYNFVGHKDGIVAQRASEMLAAKLNRKVVVVAGIHVTNLHQRGITKILEYCDTLTDKIYHAFCSRRRKAVSLKRETLGK